MGHVVRMLSLAQRMSDERAQVCFAMRADCGSAIAAVQDAGFAVRPIAPGSSFERLAAEDAADLIGIAHERDAAVVVVDHYGADREYFAALARAGIAAGAIDDLADRDLRSAGWILNPSPAFEASAYPDTPRENLLLGPAYALLREPFARARAASGRVFEANDHRVLVTFGGGETRRYRDAVVVALREREPSIEVEQPERFGASEMARLMLWADVSVNAGGQTCWELCCLGVPMIVWSIADNQRMNARAVGSFGAGEDLGVWSDDASPANSATAVLRLLRQPQRRRTMSACGMKLVDGMGAARAAREILRRSFA